MEREESLQRIYDKIVSTLSADPSAKRIRNNSGEQFIYHGQMSVGVAYVESAVSVRILVRREMTRFFRPDKCNDHWRRKMEIKDGDELALSSVLLLIKGLICDVEFVRRVKSGKLLRVAKWKDELSRTARSFGLKRIRSRGNETFLDEKRSILRLKGKQRRLRIFFSDEPSRFGLEKKFYKRIKGFFRIFYKMRYVAEVYTVEQFIRLLTYFQAYLSAYRYGTRIE